MNILSFLLVTLLLPPLFAGVVNRVKARFAGRRGAPLLQPYRELARLLGKGLALSTTTTPVFALGPAASLAAALAAACVAPLPGGVALAPFAGDLLFFAAALGAGRILLVLSALDTGSAFEGMGASREASWGAFAEPALFLLAGALVATRGFLPFAELARPAGAGLALAVSDGAALALLLLLLLVEGSRVPVDDPNTHLELTMIHEVMVLDHGGPDLAFANFAAWLRMTLFASAAVCLAFPPGLPAPALLVAHLAAILLVAVGVGVLESSIARFRLSHVPQFILLAGSASALLLAAALFSRFGGAQ